MHTPKTPSQRSPASTDLNQTSTPPSHKDPHSTVNAPSSAPRGSGFMQPTSSSTTRKTGAAGHHQQSSQASSSMSSPSTPPLKSTHAAGNVMEQNSTPHRHAPLDIGGGNPSMMKATPSSSVASSSDNIHVMLRFRPINDLELRMDPKLCVRFPVPNTVEITHQMSLVASSPMTNEINSSVVGGNSTNETFKDSASVASGNSEQQKYSSALTRITSMSFGKIYGFESEQEDIYREVGAPVVADVLNGYNGTIFVYGQTGSGKTFTMLGPPEVFLAGAGESPSQQPTTSQSTTKSTGNINASNAILSNFHVNFDSRAGVIPRAICDLFERIDAEKRDFAYEVTVCYVEIYCEKIRDLLVKETGERTNLLLREDPLTRSFKVQGCQTYFVSSAENVLKLVSFGNKQRATAATKINNHSSRSHAVLNISVKSIDHQKGEQRVGKLFLVDLAGSEKVKKTEAQGQQLAEAQKINLSLSTLGLVIMELGSTERVPHISYRNSLLTKMLQDSLGGNSKTTLIICCSPSAYNSEETLSTLRFGAGAGRIKNRPVINADLTREELKLMLAKLQHENDEMRRLGFHQHRHESNTPIKQKIEISGEVSDEHDEEARVNMKVLELEARLEQQETRHQTELSSLQQGLDEALRDQQEAEIKEGQWKAGCVSFEQECNLWEAEYKGLKAELGSLQQALHVTRQAHANHLQAQLEGIAGSRTQLETVTNQCREVISTLEEKEANANMELQKHIDTTGQQSQYIHQLEQMYKELDLSWREIQNENVRVNLQLEGAEMTLTSKNARIENLTNGLQQDRKTIADLLKMKKNESGKSTTEIVRLRGEVEEWRSKYESLLRTMNSHSQQMAQQHDGSTGSTSPHWGMSHPTGGSKIRTVIQAGGKKDSSVASQEVG